MTDTSTDALELLEACARRNKYDLSLVCMPCGKCKREISMTLVSCVCHVGNVKGNKYDLSLVCMPCGGNVKGK